DMGIVWSSLRSLYSSHLRYTCWFPGPVSNPGPYHRLAHSFTENPLGLLLSIRHEPPRPHSAGSVAGCVKETLNGGGNRTTLPASGLGRANDLMESTLIL